MEIWILWKHLLNLKLVKDLLQKCATNTKVSYCWVMSRAYTVNIIKVDSIASTDEPVFVSSVGIKPFNII